MKKVFFAALAATALLTACNKPGATKANLKSDVDSLSYVIGYSNPFANEEQLKQYLVQQGSDSTFVEEFFKGIKAGLKSGNDKKEMAYQLGLQSGMQMKSQLTTGIEQQVFAGDSTRHLSIDKLLIGLSDSRKGTSAIRGKDGQKLDEQAIQALAMELFQRMSAASNEKVYGPKKQEGEKYMAEVAKKPGIKKLDKGVYYEVNKEGNGPVPTADMQVEVEYEGKLIDGTVFDSTANHGGEPAKFVVGQVIPGWQTALTHMPVGSEWTIYIPYDQAYGDRGSGQIPPYSTLIFKVKLINCGKAEAPQQPQIQMQ